MSEERIAPDGSIYVCHACGKTSRDQYGYSKEYPETSLGWDVSCVMNSHLYKIDRLEFADDIVIKILPSGESK